MAGTLWKGLLTGAPILTYECNRSTVVSPQMGRCCFVIFRFVLTVKALARKENCSLLKYDRMTESKTKGILFFSFLIYAPLPILQRGGWKVKAVICWCQP